jgi:pimeloyl-ACP methyl ester carboxylesterase
MNYQIQGLSIHAEVHGTAEPALVFLHYWGGTSRTWRKVSGGIPFTEVCLSKSQMLDRTPKPFDP